MFHWESTYFGAWTVWYCIASSSNAILYAYLFQGHCTPSSRQHVDERSLPLGLHDGNTPVADDVKNLDQGTSANASAFSDPLQSGEQQDHPAIASSDLSIFRSPDDKTYHCPFAQCSRLFTRVYDFKRHMMIHTGEKPFACPACSYRANQKSSIKQHYISKHGLTWFD